MGETRNNFLESTRQFWQSRTKRQLTHEDARQITENVVGYFRLLLEWQAVERRAALQGEHRAGKVGCETH